MAKKLTDQEKIDLLERFSKETKGCFYSRRNADDGLAAFTGVKSAANWIKQYYEVSPEEFYASFGLMMNEAQLEQYCDAVFEKLAKHFQGKDPVQSFEELVELEKVECPDLDMDCFCHLYPVDYFKFARAGILVHPYSSRQEREAIINPLLQKLKSSPPRFSLTAIRRFFGDRLTNAAIIPNDRNNLWKGTTFWGGIENEVFFWIEECFGMPAKEYFLKEGILCADRDAIAKKALSFAEEYHAKNGAVDRIWDVQTSDPRSTYNSSDQNLHMNFGPSDLLDYLTDLELEKGVGEKQAKILATQVLVKHGILKKDDAALQPKPVLSVVRPSDDESFIDENIKKRFTFCDDVLMKYIGKEPEVVIPAFVKEIAENAFYRKQSVTTITIPATVKVLQPYALAECKSLEKLVIEPGITVLPEGLCNCCRNLKEVVLPEGLEEIGEKAFRACSISKIHFPKTLKTVRDYAFDECAIQEIDLPDSVESIGNGAFNHFAGETINLPEGVKSIGRYAFDRFTGDEFVVPESCKLLGDCFCEAENIKRLIILSDSVKPIEDRNSSAFSMNLLYNSWDDDRVKQNLKILIYCPDATKKRLPKKWQKNCRPLSEWKGLENGSVKVSAVNLYKIPDEVIKTQLIGDADPDKAIEKRKFPRKTVSEIEAEQGTVTVINQAYTDIKRAINEIVSWKPYYDMYVAMDNYLDKEEMAERIMIVDKGHTDTSYYAEPEIDWIAPALSEKQIATRFLLLAEIADKLLTEENFKQIIASMPKTKKGRLMKNCVTRIASGNIVTKEAKVLELVARAETETNVTINAEFRAFSPEELEILEEDYLSTHISALEWKTIPDIPKQEKTVQPALAILKETIYEPESFAWKEPQFGRGLASKRYDGISLQFDIVWKLVRENGYFYKNEVDETEKIIADNSCYVWAPLQGDHSFPWEKPNDEASVKLGEIIVSDTYAGRKQFPEKMNRFFFILDMICIKDAIRKHDLALLEERAKFLSSENIDECIRFAKEENAQDSEAWLNAFKR